jgi:hypothetical protein
MPFIRVRDKITDHEYDVGDELAAAFPDDYDVIDDTPVAAPRPTVHADPATKPATKAKARAPRKSTAKPAASTAKSPEKE